MMRRTSAFLIGSCLLLTACFPPVEIRKPVDDAAISAQAKQNKPVRWQTGLGISVVESLHLLDANAILVLLRQDDELHTEGDILLLARDSGAIVWRHSRRSRPGDYALVLQTKNALVFRVDAMDKSGLLALDTGTGRERWYREFDAPSVNYLPLPKTGSLLIIAHHGASVRLHGFDPFAGRVKWQRRFEAKSEVPAPVVSAGEIWHFFDGVEKLSGSDGKRLWRRTGISLGANSPPPQPDGKALYLIDANNRLHGLDASSGRSLFSSDAAGDYRISNIYPLGKRIYLRGRKKVETGLSIQESVQKAVAGAVAQALGGFIPGKGEYRLLALSRKTGKRLWSSTVDKPSLSNLVESRGVVYHATASHLIALDRSTGKHRFAKMVTNAGQNYPVHIRLIGNKIVFLGEWIVAAFDRNTGKQRYRHGMNPVPDSRATMTDYYQTIEMLREELLQGSRGGQSLSRALVRETMHFQNLSNHYNRLAWRYRSQSRGSKGSTANHYRWQSFQAQNRAQIESAFSSAYSSMAMTSAIWELNAQLEKAFHQENLKAKIADLTLFRKAILDGFTRAENQKYYYRPHNDLNDFIGVSIVNLRTGKRRDVSLSPRYQDYGIWNLIDLNRGVIYHHGIGLDTKRHHYLEQSRGVNRFMIYESYLIAREVTLP